MEVVYQWYVKWFVNGMQMVYKIKMVWKLYINGM